jgi:hypothetical protein
MVAAGEADRPFEITTDAAPTGERRTAIADRLLRGCFLPVLQALDEEVAEPAAFDRGAREALKFGIGPCALMARLGAAEVERIVAPALRSYGIPRPRSLNPMRSPSI